MEMGVLYVWGDVRSQGLSLVFIINRATRLKKNIYEYTTSRRYSHMIFCIRSYLTTIRSNTCKTELPLPLMSDAWPIEGEVQALYVKKILT